MLIRKNYYDYKRNKIENLVLKVIDYLNQMMEQSVDFLLDPSKHNKSTIMETEHNINYYEKKTEKNIMEIISLEQLDKSEIKWMFSMGRIIKDLERVGDQLINILTVSDMDDTNELRNTVSDFFKYEQTMIKYLSLGIKNDDQEKLKEVIEHDVYVNNLNKETFQEMVDLIETESFTESKLKVVIVSRFLERVGDHLVNAAKLYKRSIDETIN